MEFVTRSISECIRKTHFLRDSGHPTRFPIKTDILGYDIPARGSEVLITMAGNNNLTSQFIYDGQIGN